jgi:hypothetical protein
MAVHGIQSTTPLYGSLATAPAEASKPPMTGAGSYNAGNTFTGNSAYAGFVSGLFPHLDPRQLAEDSHAKIGPSPT